MKKWYLLCLIAIGFACSKNKEIIPKPTSLVGKWKLSDIYGNEYWGGPLHWKKPTASIEIEFKANGEYYRSPTDGSVPELKGTYRVLSDSTLEITQKVPVNPDYPSYRLDYRFEDGGYLTWGIFGYEGVVEERFRKETNY
ncbi:MAG: hypothetical protein J7576_17605 [Siphonobacter aquaeclarae]|jgi:hypothetical protein|nr:hypothetical protein [Siphonobacter aquaeclarae]